MTQIVEVWTSVNGNELLAGTARFSFRKGASTIFNYDSEYLSTKGAYALDDALKLEYGGGSCSPLPPSFRDCSPDRWGKRLIEKQHREQAGESVPRALTDVDYLLGVSDATRQGALRFRSNGEWLGAGTPIPPAVDLYELLQASHDVANDAESHEELKALLDAGTTALGGAHPKASVRDGDKLLMAKFSHPQDDHDVIGLEKTMLDLQERCGITAPARKLVRFGKHAALLTERFDRKEGEFDGERIPYKSAMTVLNLSDGERASYLDLLLKMQQEMREGGVEQMLKRICFSYVFNNTDDHLKNHGFLLKKGKWELSPCFDVNPSLFAKERATAIMGGGKPEHEQFIELCELFGLDVMTIESIVNDVDGAAQTFKNVAAKNNVPQKETLLVAKITAERTALLKAAVR